jgi:hypothetical protein
MQNSSMLVMLSSSDQNPGSQRQGDGVLVAALALFGHAMHAKALPSKAAKGVVVGLVVLLVVAIVCPVSWQVRGAALPIKPKPVAQPSKLQVLFIVEACRKGDN